jgi:hypothetical protein
MSSEIKVGKGIGDASTLFLFKIAPCDPTCIYKNPHPLRIALELKESSCQRNNGSAVIVLGGGIDRYTAAEVRDKAKCIVK